MKITIAQLLFLIEHRLIHTALVQAYDSYRVTKASGRKLDHPQLSEFLSSHLHKIRRGRRSVCGLLGVGTLLLLIGLLVSPTHLSFNVCSLVSGIICYFLITIPIFDIQSSNKMLRVVLDDFNDLAWILPASSLSSQDECIKNADELLGRLGKELNRNELTLGFYYGQTMNLRNQLIHHCQTFEKFDLPHNPRKYYNIPCVAPMREATEPSSSPAAQATS